MFRRLPRSTRTEPSFPTRRSSDLPIGFLRAVHPAGVDAEAPDIIFIGELPDRIGIVALARRDEITAVDALGHDRQTFHIVAQTHAIALRPRRRLCRPGGARVQTTAERRAGQEGGGTCRSRRSPEP